jgi:hypothetical protein
VRALLHSVYDQPDGDSVHAQFDRVLEGKLPAEGSHGVCPLSQASTRLTGTGWLTCVSYDLGSTTLVTTQRCLPILRSRMNPSFS